MASPPLPDSQPIATDGDIYEVEPPPSDHNDAYGYQEEAVTRSIPIKTGEEDPSFFDSERPVSAGTAGTGEFDAHAPSDDEAVIEQYGYEKAEHTTTTDMADSGPGGNFLPKPVVSDVPDASEGFAFGRPNHPQMNITPNRAPPASYVLPTPRLTGERHPRRGSSNVLNAQDPNVMAMQDSAHATDPEFTDNQSHSEQAPTSFQPHGGKQKRKKKQSKTKPRPHFNVQEAINTADHRESIRDPGAEPEFGSHSRNTVAPQRLEVVDLEQIQDKPDENTVVQDEMRDKQGLPHFELQHDLEAAAQPPPRVVELPSGSAFQALQEADEGEMLPPDHSTDREANGQLPHPQANQRTPAGETGTSLSNPPAPSKVQKRRPEPSRRTATASQAQAANANDWRLTDYAKLFQLKAEECEAGFAWERQVLEQGIQQALEAGAAIQSELHNVLDEKQQLAATIDEQRNKVAAYEVKIKRFKTFVDGVGKDLDSIRKDANALRRRSDDIVSEVESQGSRNLAAYGEMGERVKDCKKIRDEALKLAREKDEECHRVLLHRDQLQRELDDTVGVLSEERDRCAKLESQLAECEKKLFQIMKSNHDTILDKLCLIHAAVEDEQNKKDTADMIEQLRSATQPAGSPDVAVLQDIAGIKALVEALDQRLNHNVEAVEAVEINTRAHFDDALKGVQVQLADREKLIENHRETVNDLQDQLNACKGRLTGSEAQKTAALKEVSDLKQRITALETQILILETNNSPAEDSQIQLNETKVELEKARKEFGSLKANLEAREKEIEALTASNTKLEDDVKALQDRLHQLHEKEDSTNVPKEEAERMVREAEQRTRKEMNDHFEDFETNLNIQAKNKLKKLTNENNRLENQVKPLQEENASYRQQIIQMQAGKPAAYEGLRQELERDKKRIQSLENERARLTSELSDSSKTAATSAEALQKKISSLSAQVDAERSNNSELQHQIKRLGEENEQTELEKNRAQEALANLRKETDSKIKDLEEELAEARETATRDSDGLERLKKSCKDTVDKANKDRERQVHALQAQLSQSQADFQAKQDELDLLLNEVEQANKQENQTWEQKLAESAQKVADIEANQLQAQRDYELELEELKTTMNKKHASLKEENEELRTQLQSTEEKMQSQQRSVSNEDGITPNATAGFMQPSKPRKVIDRNRSETRKVDQIRAPGEIRPDPRKANSASPQTIVKGPVVEETQFLGNPGWSSQPESQTIPETQLVDALPTFAALNSKYESTQAPLSSAPSTSDSALGIAHLTDAGQPGDHVIEVYEQDQRQGELSQSQHLQSSMIRQPNRTWNEEGNDKFAFSMPKATPNSALKRAAASKPFSGSVKRHESEQMSASERLVTPAFDMGADSADGNSISSPQTSTPDFVGSTNPKRHKTYLTPKHLTGTQHTSQLNTAPISDPRLTGRNDHGTKRKVVEEGYENERKKRLGKRGNSIEKHSRRAQPQQPQSIDDLRVIKGDPTSSRTHTQTSGRGAPGARRSTRNLSQNDQMGARFDRAISGR